MAVEGFSLLEMLAVMFIMSLLSVISIVGLSRLYASSERHAELMRLANFIEEAKIQALVNNTVFVICPSNNQQDCSDNWNSAIILKTQQGLVRILPALTSHNTLTWHRFGQGNQLTFYGARLLDNNGTFQDDSPDGVSTQLVVSKTGETHLVES